MRYAGFWPRFWALLIDFFVFIPLIWTTFWSLSTSRSTALLLEVPLGVLAAFYSIYFVGRWGQTVGKMMIGIKVVAVDGSKVGYTRAFYRHSVDLGFSAVSTALTILALLSVSSGEYDRLSFEGKLDLLATHTPSWNSLIDWLTFAWIGSELVVLLLNEKRRALHDYIAGTVVVHTSTEVPVEV